MTTFQVSGEINFFAVTLRDLRIYGHVDTHTHTHNAHTHTHTHTHTLCSRQVFPLTSQPLAGTSHKHRRQIFSDVSVTVQFLYPFCTVGHVWSIVTQRVTLLDNCLKTARCNCPKRESFIFSPLWREPCREAKPREDCMIFLQTGVTGTANDTPI